MKRPLIGITIDEHDKPDRYESPCHYSTSIEKAGGLPLLIPYKVDHALIPRYVDACDGFLLSGGNDMDPALYNQPGFHPKAIPIDPLRPRFELALLAEIERRRRPVFGICFGSQVMNVHRGGTLHQFLPDVTRADMLEHRKVGETLLRHPVTVDTTSTVGSALAKPEVSVNTYHKQAINKLGHGLRIIATAPDGVIEGFEDPTLPLFAAVQWHPERLHDEPEHLALFKLLVEKSISETVGWK